MMKKLISILLLVLCYTHSSHARIYDVRRKTLPENSCVVRVGDGNGERVLYFDNDTQDTIYIRIAYHGGGWDGIILGPKSEGHNVARLDTRNRQPRVISGHARTESGGQGASLGPWTAPTSAVLSAGRNVKREDQYIWDITQIEEWTAGWLLMERAVKNQLPIIEGRCYEYEYMLIRLIGNQIQPLEAKLQPLHAEFDEVDVKPVSRDTSSREPRLLDQIFRLRHMLFPLYRARETLVRRQDSLK